ncbi:MAG: hypothetical protein RIC84_31650 [Aggregatilineales bacterium]
MINQRAPQEMVLDTTSWSGKRGFNGADEWWSYVRNQDERRRLDHLLGVALLDENVRHRLVNIRDEDLLSAFGLSEPTKCWIITLKATSLSDIAKEVASNFQMSA